MKKNGNERRNASRLGAKTSKVGYLIIKIMFIPWKILDIGIGVEIVSGTVTTKTFFQIKYDRSLLQLNQSQLLFLQTHPKDAGMVDRLMVEFCPHCTV